MAVTIKQMNQILLRLPLPRGRTRWGIAILDGNRTARFVNDLWAEMHGYDNSSELIGKDLNAFHTDKQMTTDVIAFLDEAEHREQLTGPLGHLRKNGTVFDTQTKVIPARDECGNIVALVVLAVGATDNGDREVFASQRIGPIVVASDRHPQQTTSQTIESSSFADQDIGDTDSSFTSEDTARTFAQQIDEINVKAPDATAILAEKSNEFPLSARVTEQALPIPEPDILPKNELAATPPAERNGFEERLQQVKGNAEIPEDNKQKAEAEISKISDHDTSLQHNHQRSLPEIVYGAAHQETSLQDVCYILFRHKWKMIVFFLAVISIVAAVTLLTAPAYRSEAKLWIRLGHESVTLDPTAATGQIMPVLQSRDNEINSELEILRSRELIEKVVDSVGAQALLDDSGEQPLGATADKKQVSAIKSIVHAAANKLSGVEELLGSAQAMNDRDKATLKLSKDLNIENLKDSSIISISCVAASPAMAQKIVAMLTDLYLGKHIAIHRTLGSPAFFGEQANQLRDALAKSEEELRNLKNQTGISSVAEQQRVLLGRIGTLSQEIAQTDASLASSTATVDALRRVLADVPKTIVTEETKGFPNVRADEMRKQLFERQLEELRLTTNFTEESPTVKAIRKEISEAQSLFNKEEPNRTQITRGLSKTYEQLESSLLTEQTVASALRAKNEAQRKQFIDAQAELKTLNDAEAKIAFITRETSIQEMNYRKYSENLAQARINSAMENEKISNISVVQAATIPIKAVKPNKPLNLALGLFLGVLGAIVLAIFSEQFDHSIKTPEEAEEKLQLPVLGYVPRVRIGRVFPRLEARREKTLKNKMVRGQPTEMRTPASISEYYEALRERLLARPDDPVNRPYVLAVAGSRRREGASCIAANLAAAFSRHNENGGVLLVDANIKHPYIHRVAKTKLSPGWIDVLTNGHTYADTIQIEPAGNVHSISSGSPNGNSVNTFDSGKVKMLLDSIKKRYRFVVIDIPPLNETSSAARLAGLCDGTILVVAAERLRREILQTAKTRLLESNANILGVVLNKRQLHVPGWLYRRL